MKRKAMDIINALAMWHDHAESWNAYYQDGLLTKATIEIIISVEDVDDEPYTDWSILTMYLHDCGIDPDKVIKNRKRSTLSFLYYVE